MDPTFPLEIHMQIDCFHSIAPVSSHLDGNSQVLLLSALFRSLLIMLILDYKLKYLRLLHIHVLMRRPLFVCLLTMIECVSS